MRERGVRFFSHSLSLRFLFLDCMFFGSVCECVDYKIFLKKDNTEEGEERAKAGRNNQRFPLSPFSTSLSLGAKPISRAALD